MIEDRIVKLKALAVDRIDDAKAYRKVGDHAAAVIALKTAAKVTARVLELQNYGASSITRKAQREQWASDMLPKLFDLAAS